MTDGLTHFVQRLHFAERRPQRIAPPVAAQHTMRAQALLALGDSTKHQNKALQHLEAAFVAAHPVRK